MPTDNPTERKIHQSGQQGSLIADKIVTLLEERKRGRAGTIHKEFADQITRTDIWFQTETYGKVVEVKFSSTSKICPSCKKIEKMHRDHGCQCTDPFIATHKNCDQRFHEARGKIFGLALSPHWESTRWAGHFLYFDLCDEGGPMDFHKDLIENMEKANSKYGVDTRVKVYTHMPRQTDYLDIVTWILDP